MYHSLWTNYLGTAVEQRKSLFLHTDDETAQKKKYLADSAQINDTTTG